MHSRRGSVGKFSWPITARLCLTQAVIKTPIGHAQRLEYRDRNSPRCGIFTNLELHFAFDGEKITIIN